MSVQKRVFCLFLPVILLLFPMLSQAVEVTVIPTIPTTITYAQLSQFGVVGSRMNTQLFHVRIDNSGGSELKSVVAIYSVELTTGTSPMQVLYKGASDPQTISANQQLDILSTDFLDEESSALFHIKNRIERVSSESFTPTVFGSGTIPSGVVRMTVYLAQGTPFSNVKISESSVVDIEIINISQLDLVSPGSSTADLSDGVTEIYNPSPRFTWVSDLQSMIYANCNTCNDQSSYEISIYERAPGARTNEVLASTPLFRTKTTVPYLDYPFSAKALVPGTTYLWQVKGLLKGVYDVTLLSEPSAFKLAKITDPEVEYMVNKMRSILSASDYYALWESLIHDYNSGISIRDGDLEISHDKIKELESKFTSGQYKVINMKVE